MMQNHSTWNIFKHFWNKYSLFSKKLNIISMITNKTTNLKKNTGIAKRPGFNIGIS